ncbi:hypothetical protein BDN72DRAFT_775105, partial [Pluteus cervinus]
HSQARNVVERIFGVFKRRFGLLTAVAEYPEKAQAKFIPALAVLHNFLRIHDPSDLPAINSTIPIYDNVDDNTTFTITARERKRAAARRDIIAKAMWTDYQATLRARGMLQE